MKRFVSILLALLLCLALVGCGSSAPSGHEAESNVPPRPKDSSFEFWIADSVELADFDGHDQIGGWFGAWEFLGTGYHAVTDEDGMNASRPDIYVTYVITAYPDYSSGALAVTKIAITDPAVTVYGLTVESPLEEWDAVFREMGYEIRDPFNTETLHLAEKDGFTFAYGDGMIRISAEVTNEQGIMF